MRIPERKKRISEKDTEEGSTEREREEVIRGRKEEVVSHIKLREPKLTFKSYVKSDKSEKSYVRKDKSCVNNDKMIEAESEVKSCVNNDKIIVFKSCVNNDKIIDEAKSEIEAKSYAKYEVKSEVEARRYIDCEAKSSDRIEDEAKKSDKMKLEYYFKFDETDKIDKNLVSVDKDIKNGGKNEEVEVEVKATVNEITDPDDFEVAEKNNLNSSNRLYSDSIKATMIETDYNDDTEIDI